MTRKNTFVLSALLLCLLLLIDIISLTRMISRSMEEIKIETTRGRFEIIKLKPTRGSLISVRDNAVATDFSCALAGLREFSGCFLIEDWMYDQKVLVKWFEVPQNVFTGAGRYPLEFDFFELNKKITLGSSPKEKMADLIFSKIKGIILIASLYLIIMAIVLKLINLNKGEEK